MRSRTVEKVLGPAFILAVGVVAYAVFSGASFSWPFTGSQTSSFASTPHMRTDVVRTGHHLHHKQAQRIDAGEDYAEQLRASQSGTGGGSPSRHPTRTLTARKIYLIRHMTPRQFRAWMGKPHGVP